MNHFRRIASITLRSSNCRYFSVIQRNVLPSYLKTENAVASTKSYSDSPKGVVQDFAIPTEAWPQEAINIYNQLKQLTEHPNWVQHPGKYIERESGNRMFLRAVPNKQFLYSLFLNAEERQAKGVITFGPWAEGGKNHVHGGAVATILDSIMGVLSNVAIAPSVTANLNVDYVRPFRLGQACMVQAHIKNVDGRKIFLESTITDITGESLVVKGTSLYIKVKKPTESEFMNE